MEYENPTNPGARMSENLDSIRKPDLRTLKEYLHYQHPSTQGDIRLNELCDHLRDFFSMPICEDRTAIAMPPLTPPPADYET